jgi:hypothetical protein
VAFESICTIFSTVKDTSGAATASVVNDHGNGSAFLAELFKSSRSSCGDMMVLVVVIGAGAGVVLCKLSVELVGDLSIL